MKDIVARFLELAPNLVGIVAMNCRALKFVPEGKYGLLKSLEFKLNTKAEDVDMLRKIATQSCQLEQVVVHDGYTEYTAKVFEENFDVRVRHQLKTTVQQLLQTCQSSLRSISVNSKYYSLAQLSLVPLIKLTKFKTERGSATTELHPSYRRWRPSWIRGNGLGMRRMNWDWDFKR